MNEAPTYWDPHFIPNSTVIVTDKGGASAEAPLPTAATPQAPSTTSPGPATVISPTVPSKNKKWKEVCTDESSCSKCKLFCTCSWCESHGTPCVNRQSCGLRGKQCTTCTASECRGKRAKRLRTHLGVRHVRPKDQAHLYMGPRATFSDSRYPTLRLNAPSTLSDMNHLIQRSLGDQPFTWEELDTEAGPEAESIITYIPQDALLNVLSQLVVTTVGNELCARKKFIDGCVIVVSGFDVDIHSDRTTQNGKLILCISGQTLVATSTSLLPASLFQTKNDATNGKMMAPPWTTPESNPNLFRMQSDQTIRIDHFFARRGDIIHVPPHTGFQLKTFGQTNMCLLLEATPNTDSGISPANVVF